MPGTVGVGVIGVGFMGRTHIASYARTAGCTLRAVCDPAQKAAAVGNLATTGDDAERLTNAVHVDSTRGLLRVSTLQECGNAAGELEVLETACQLTGCVRRHLAVLERDDVGEFLAVRVEQLAHAEHDLGALRKVRGTPRGERRLVGCDDCIHLGDRG